MATGSSSEASPPAVAALVVDLARSRPATLGSGRLVCVDGPAGSGKTTLAAAVAALTGAQVVHMDDLMAGWAHATDTESQLRSIVEPLRDGRPGSYRHFDWHLGRFDRTVGVPAAAWLVVEGVGSGQAVISEQVTVLAWVEVGDELRLARGLERDGAEMEPHWRQFMRDETTLFERDGTRGRADVLVDGHGERAPVVR